MSTSRGSVAGSGVGVQPIPAGSRKMVQSLKEIVNYSEAEIYATLKDCNMDPNEAVNRLLSQAFAVINYSGDLSTAVAFSFFLALSIHSVR